MFRVQYDAQIFTSQRFGGISRYFVELIKNMPESMSTDVSVVFSHNLHLQEALGVRNFPDLPGKKDLVKFLNYRRSKSVMKKGNYDIFHPTYYNPYFLDYNKRPYVITVHDMIHERFPEAFSPKDTTSESKRRIVESAAGVIAISESTKRDLLELFDLPEEKVKVVYHGQGATADTEEPVPGIADDYILYVGGRNLYKNFNRMAEAFAVILKSYPELNLICTGKPFSTGERDMLVRLGIADRVTAMFVNDRQLRYLYAHARCFVFPSLYEGFGFPVLESFTSGCPAALSNCSSLPEIGGDGALYFDPNDVGDISDVVCRIVGDDELRRRLVERGREIASGFSWEKAAKSTAEFYQECAGR